MKCVSYDKKCVYKDNNFCSGCGWHKTLNINESIVWHCTKCKAPGVQNNKFVFMEFWGGTDLYCKDCIVTLEK